MVDDGWRKGEIKSNEGFRRYRVVMNEGQEFVQNQKTSFSNIENQRTIDLFSSVKSHRL